MEEKLNLIYGKLLEIKSTIDEENYNKRIKELEYEQENITEKINDIKYHRENQYRYDLEMMDNFKSLGKQIQEEGKHVPYLD